MRITIIGAGAMGCLYGARLSQAGHDVTMVDVRSAVIDAINTDGLQLEGVSGSVQAPASASTPEQATGPTDLVCVQAHAAGSVQAAQVAHSILAPDGYAITLQNGIGNVEALVDQLDEERVLGGISYNSASSDGPGRSRHTNPGTTWIGELDGRVSTRATALGDAFESAGLPTTVSDNIIGVIWDKFVHNCAINPIAAVLGLRADKLSGCPSANTFQDRLLDELLALVKAKGIRLAEEDPVEAIKETCRSAPVIPSMLQHVEAGVTTEIEAQNGAAVREGRALGLSMPFNEAVALLVSGLTERSQLSALADTP